LFHVLSKPRHRLCWNIGREHAARSNPLAEDDAHVAVAGADVGDGHSRFELEHVCEPRDVDLRLLALLRDLLCIRLLRRESDGRAGQGRTKYVRAWEHAA